jgi:hypothetical protein
MRSLAILAGLAAGFCALFTSPASAAGIYTVSHISVDVSAPDPGAARAAGFDQARKIGFDRLVKRLALPDEIARLGAPQLTPDQLDQIASSIQIEQERPQGARYVGQLAVNFDPAGVRKTLRDRGLTVVETRAAPLLVVPEFPDNPALAGQWRDAWAQGDYGDELAPIAVAPDTLTGSPNWMAAAGDAGAAGSASALYALARLAGPSLIVDLVEVGPNGARRERGPVSVSYAPADPAGSFQNAAAGVNALIQNEWKAKVAVSGAQRTRITVSAYYGNEAEWGRMKGGLEGAAKTLISGVSIDAVSKQAAVISFAYAGTQAQLAAELLRNGVTLQDTPQGIALRLAP